MPFLDQLLSGAPVPEPVAIVAAHPDDETLGLGSLLHRLPHLRIIHLTDGAPRDLGDARRAGFPTWQDYAAAREAELCRALEKAGAPGVDRCRYGWPDQQAIFHIADIVARLVEDLTGMRAVFTHPYEHGHPDHDSAALCVAIACARLAERSERPPERYEFPSYHLAHGQALFGAFWSDPDRPEREIRLIGDDLARKQRAIACFTTQQAVLAPFPVGIERFRAAPDYDFRAPAPPGEALYDRYGWNMTAALWRRTAAEALDHLAPD